MTIEFSLDDVDTETIGGFDRVAVGSYHIEITDFNEDGGKKGEMIVTGEILRGTTPNQEGKELRLFFAKEFKPLPKRKFLALALATGIMTKQALDQHKKNGTLPPLDFSGIVGKQICVNLEENEWEGKVTTRLAYDEIYHPTDKRANHIPLHVAKLAKAGIKLPEGRDPNVAIPTRSGPKPTAKPDPSKQAASVDALLGGGEVNF